MSLPVDVKMLLLEALREGEAFGLELIDRIEQRAPKRVRLPQGSVYPALRALEEQGLVRSRETEPLPDRGGKPRIYYALTGKGRSAAAEGRQLLESLFLLRADDA